MNQEELMKQIVEEVMKSMSGQVAKTTSHSTGNVTKENYPLGENMADKVFSPTGKKLSEMTFDKLLSGELKAEDMRISAETLEMQAQVSESVGNDAFAANLRRAAELIAVPDDRLLEIYNALRPYRSTKAELEAIAHELETQYNAPINAELVRSAATVYEKRGRLKTV